MNKFKKIICILFNLQENDKRMSVKTSLDECVEMEKSGYDKKCSSEELVYMSSELDPDSLVKFKSMVLALISKKNIIGFNVYDGAIEIYINEYQVKSSNNGPNVTSSGHIYINGSSTDKNYSININKNGIHINNNFFEDKDFLNSIREDVKKRMQKVNNTLAAEAMDEIIDLTGIRRELNLDELLKD